MTTLKTLIESEPANAAKTDAQVLAWLKETIQVQGAVSHAHLLQWSASGRRTKLDNAVSNGEPIGSMAKTAISLLNDGVSTFDTADTGNVTLLNALVTATVITQSDMDALMNAGLIDQMRGQGHRLTEGAVNRARNP